MATSWSSQPESDLEVIVEPESASSPGTLAYEPTVLRGKNGERIWHVDTTRECVDLCRLQLKVHIPS
jgi:hypothetical protein